MSDEFDEKEDELKESGDNLNPDALEDALGDETSDDEFEEDDSDGVYLKPKKNTGEEEEEDLDNEVDLEDD